jgi:recombination protein RecA
LLTKEQSSFQNFIEKLNPKVAQSIKRASEVHNETLPLASRRLTRALNGGIGRGRISLFYGNRSSGKSALMQQSIANWQKQGLVCAYIDVEKTWDAEWATRLGVNCDELILEQQVSFARVNERIAPLIEAGIDVIVIDSLTMMMPDEFIDDDGKAKGLEDMRKIGAHAVATGRLLSSMHYLNNESKTAIVIISQTRTDINAYGQQKYSGGKAMDFGTSQIVRLTSNNSQAKQIMGKVRHGDLLIEEAIGRKVECLVEKNKMGPQSKTCEYDFYYDGDNVGVDAYGEVLDDAVLCGFVKKAGAWFKYGEISWQGRLGAIAAIRADENLYQELQDKVAEVLG